ncbi:MAG TPA: hypothetical protein VEY10_03285 [Flavisolibacter sp.]|nr:hypothetical protein [Flavisolibacter sp.]
MCPGIRLVLKTGLSFLISCPSTCLQAQRPDTAAAYQIVAAGTQYNTSPLHQKLWGNHYRKDWNTPVRFKKFYLDTAVGGLTPYQEGGGRQTKSLRLHDAQQREYVLRSVDKDFGRGLPEIYHNTFVEKFLNDQISIAQPYAALTIPLMAEAAKIYHTWPQIVFVPRQKALDTFNARFGNALYLFEQRPDENWAGAKNLANSKNIIGTERLLEKITDDSRHRIDQALYVRSRLFDMLIGDWGRHEDQWRWATVEQGDITVYKPIPRDRDQAYTKFDGLFIRLAKSAAGAGHLQTFDYKIKDITTFNFPARNLDRRVANETTLRQWKAIAYDLQQSLTDEIITASVKQLPPEVFDNTGPVLIAKLKQRKADLVKYATDYYLFLAREVDITGTKETEYFEVTNLPDGNVVVKMFGVDSSDKKDKKPFYERTFLPGETKEIRLYGIGGKDSYEVTGGKKDIRIRVIAGEADDAYKTGPKTIIKVYDSKSQIMDVSAGTRLYSSGDSASRSYLYQAFNYDKKGAGPVVFYDGDDRLFVGANYKALIHRWRKEPFGQRHNLYARYSINQRALSFGYEGIFNQVAGKWSLLANAYYDLVRWTNFFGLGNNTPVETDNRDFYRVRSKEAWISASFHRQIGRQSVFTIAPFYRYVQLLKNEDRFLAKRFFYGNGSSDYNGKNFVGVQTSLDFQRLNNVLIPTKGIRLSAGVTYTKNLSEWSGFANYSGNLKLFLPLSNRFMMSIENGAATTIDGEPEFYQLNTIGGSRLRGHRRDRFWGETIFHNNNELHYLWNVRSHLFNGKLGVMTFVDQGRVWKRGEASTTWHNGYGGGITIVPFNKVYLSLQYGVSKEDGTIHLELRRSL